MTTCDSFNPDVKSAGKQTQPAPQELWQRYHLTADAEVEDRCYYYSPLPRLSLRLWAACSRYTTRIACIAYLIKQETITQRRREYRKSIALRQTVA